MTGQHIASVQTLDFSTLHATVLGFERHYGLSTLELATTVAAGDMPPGVPMHDVRRWSAYAELRDEYSPKPLDPVRVSEPPSLQNA